MTWDLISIKSNTQDNNQESFIFLNKSIQHSERDSVNAFQYLIQLHPLPLLEQSGPSKSLINIGPSQFKVIVDLDEQKILFDIANADAALPTILQSKGLGSIAVSELVLWCNKNYPDYTIATTHVSPTLLNYTNGEMIAARFLKNFKFTISKSPKGGIQFTAETASALNAHINHSKVESCNPTQWGSKLIEDNLNASKQIHELNQDITTLKDQLFQTHNRSRSHIPFLSGILAGFVAGAAIASLIFSV